MIDCNHKILVFTDLHFGIHSNTPSYIDICKNTMKWIKDYSVSNGIKDILFMGDFFDSRASIDIKTLNTATESLYDISESGIKIALILGNHDIYLRDSTSIHSLYAFNGHDGITVIDKPLITDSIAFLPWQYGTVNGEKIEIPSTLKYVFCHHNFPVDFFLVGNKNTKKKRLSDTFESKNKYSEEYGFQNGIVETVIKNEGTIFSGHIHNRRVLPVGQSGNTKIVIEGSPYETNWGFYNIDCGAYVVDFESGAYEFINNPYNKKHVEIRTSKFDKEFDTIDFQNSIIRLNVDTQESFDAISKMQSRIQQKKPFSVENTKYEFTVAEFVGKNESENANHEESIAHGVSSKLDYVKKAIDEADFSSFNYMKGTEVCNIDKNKLKDIATELFEKGK